MSIFLAKYIRYLFGPDTTTWHLAGAGDSNGVGYVNYVDGVGYVDANHASGPYDAIDTGSICDAGYTAAPSGLGDWDDSSYGYVCRPIIITTPGTPATLWFYNYSTNQVAQITHYYVQGQDIVASDIYESVEVVYTCFPEGTNPPDSTSNSSGGFPVFPGFPSGGGGTSGGGTSGGGTSGGGTSGGGTSGGGTSGGGTSGGESPQPIEIPATYTLWLKGGKLIVTADNHPILCDSCPCAPQLTACSAAFSLYLDFHELGHSLLHTVQDSSFRAHTLAPGYELNQNVAVLFTVPTGGTITRVTVTEDYTNANAATFFSAAVTSAITGQSLSLDIINTLRSIWFWPGVRPKFSCIVYYDTTNTQSNNCVLSITNNSISVGTKIAPMPFYIETTDPLGPGGVKRVQAGGKTGWRGDQELWAVPEGAGTSPASGTGAYRADDGTPVTVGSHRPAWYDGVTPVAYNELPNVNAVLVERLDTDVLECTETGSTGLYNVFQYIDFGATCWTDSETPGIGATVYWPSNRAWDSTGEVSSTFAYTAQGAVDPSVAYCNHCTETRGGTQTVPEEFE